MKKFEKLAPLFKSLSDETRLEIMALLTLRGELCVCDFEGLLGVSQSKSSRHLRYLYNAGLVQVRRGGKWMYYRLPDEPTPAARILIRTVATLVDPELRAALERRLDAWYQQKARDGSSSCDEPEAKARPVARRGAPRSNR